MWKQLEFHTHCWWEWKAIPLLYKVPEQFLLIVRHTFIIQPWIPLLGIYSKQWKHALKKPCPRMLVWTWHHSGHLKLCLAPLETGPSRETSCFQHLCKTHDLAPWLPPPASYSCYWSMAEMFCFPVPRPGHKAQFLDYSWQPTTDKSQWKNPPICKWPWALAPMLEIPSAGFFSWINLYWLCKPSQCRSSVLFSLTRNSHRSVIHKSLKCPSKVSR
jgi:hypothetical protein